MSKNCPHIEDLDVRSSPEWYHQISTDSDEAPCIAVAREEYIGAILSPIYEGESNGEVKTVKVSGYCTVASHEIPNRVLITRECFEKFCINNHINCPRFIKKTDK